LKNGCHAFGNTLLGAVGGVQNANQNTLTMAIGQGDGMTYVNRLVEIQVRGVLIAVILNGNKVMRSTRRNYRNGVEPIAPNVLRLCVCLPLAQSFKLPQMLMGQIAQNRCYRQ